MKHADVTPGMRVVVTSDLSVEERGTVAGKTNPVTHMEKDTDFGQRVTVAMDDGTTFSTHPRNLREEA